MAQNTPAFLGVIGAFMLVGALSLALNTDWLPVVASINGAAFLISACLLVSHKP